MQTGKASLHPLEEKVSISRHPEQRRLYQQVAEQIRHFVRGEGLSPGAKLPGERDLAVRLGVSRPSLREALIALEIEGTVEVRLGSGVYLLPEQPVAPHSGEPMGDSPSDLMQARIAVEGTVALLAAARVTPEAIAQLAETLDSMQDEIAAERSPVAHDRAFHKDIATLCGNAVLVRIVGELFDGRHSPISEKFQDKFGTPQTWRLALSEHRAILSALESKDGLLAQTMMRHHLDSSRQRWIALEPHLTK